MYNYKGCWQQSVYCTEPFIIISLLLQFHTFQFLSFSSSLWTTITTASDNTSWVGHNVSEALTGLWLEHLEKRGNIIWQRKICWRWFVRSIMLVSDNPPPPPPIHANFQTPLPTKLSCPVYIIHRRKFAQLLNLNYFQCKMSNWMILANMK